MSSLDGRMLDAGVGCRLVILVLLIVAALAEGAIEGSPPHLTSTTTNPSAGTVVTVGRATVARQILPGNANAFVDEALDHWRELIRASDYDPLEVSSLQLGPVSCSTCHLEGLSTLFRAGDVTLNASRQAMVVDVQLGFGSLRARCSCQGRWMFLTASGVLHGTLDNYSVSGRLVQEAANGGRVRRPELTLLRVTNPGQLTTRFDGNGFFGTLVQWFGQDMIKKRVRLMLSDESRIRQLIDAGLVGIDLSTALTFA